jgi:signal transduction histidine kinase
VAVAAYQAGRDAVLEVVDDGIGIPVEERARLFDRFYRGREARRVRPDGSGLGLSIAAWVAAAHRGTVSVTPVAPTGSRFTVRMPLRDGRAGAFARGAS